MNADELRNELEQLAGPVPRPDAAARDAVARRVTRARRRVGASSALAAVLVVAIVAAGVHAAQKSPVGIRTIASTTTPAGATDRSCAAGVHVVPPDQVPRAVENWAGGRRVVGGGELWTARSAIDVRGTQQPDGTWLMKFPWFTRPFGLPRIDGRRLDGAGTFRFDVNRAVAEHGAFVTSSLIFSTAGCWEVTGSFDTSKITFRVLVGAPPQPLAIGTISGTLAMVGGRAPGIDRGVAGFIRVISATGGWDGQTDGHGNFRVDVPAGRYDTVRGTSPSFQSGQAPCQALAPVVVRAGHTTRVQVVCPVR